MFCIRKQNTLYQKLLLIFIIYTNIMNCLFPLSIFHIILGIYCLVQLKPLFFGAKAIFHKRRHPPNLNEDVIIFPDRVPSWTPSKLPLKMLAKILLKPPLKTQQRRSKIMCSEYTKLACPSNGIMRRMSQIVGGENAVGQEYPHMALIGYGDQPNIRWLCGGSLISNNFVMSAAHCAISFTQGPAGWVRLGELVIDSTKDDAKPLDMEIVDRIVYPLYKNTSLYHDIALFRLKNPIIFNSYIRPVCLHDDDNIATQDYLIATGWGQTGLGELASSSLQTVSLDFISMNICSVNYGTGIRYEHGLDANAMICAGSFTGLRDTCVGDSGGPLLIRIPNCSRHYSQIGITSFGRNCAEINYPGVYTKVVYYLDWIESVVWK